MSRVDNVTRHYHKSQRPASAIYLTHEDGRTRSGISTSTVTQPCQRNQRDHGRQGKPSAEYSPPLPYKQRPVSTVSTATTINPNVPRPRYFKPKKREDRVTAYPPPESPNRASRIKAIASSEGASCGISMAPVTNAGLPCREYVQFEQGRRASRRRVLW